MDDKIIELTRRSVSDALSVADPAGEITALAAELAGIENKIRQQDELRRSWPEKLAELRELAVQIAAAQQRGRQARETVARDTPEASATWRMVGEAREPPAPRSGPSATPPPPPLQPAREA